MSQASTEPPFPLPVRRYTAAGGVVFDEGRVLVLDRPDRGEVRLPKGHVEEGESHEETALRETAEESGYIDLEIESDLGSRDVSFVWEGTWIIRTEHYFLMRLTSRREAPRSEKDTAQFHPMWVDIGEAEAVLTYEPEQEVLQRARAAEAGEA